MTLVVAGRIVPLSNDGSSASEKTTFAGKVWIGDDGRIAAVTRGTKKGPPGFDGGPTIDVGSHLVVPGFIDLHSHLAYATLPLWAEPNRTQPFAHHNIWPSRPTYTQDVTWPASAFVEAAPEELLAYAEIRALIGGTTSIQGSPPRNRPIDGWLVRNVEDETLGDLLGHNQVLASTLTMTLEQLGDRAEKMRDGATLFYHCSEGQHGSLVLREYTDARTTGCLQRRMVAIHTNALQSSDYNKWSDVGSIVWSPFSNLWLYGSTTKVPAAISRKIRVCLGSDWGPSGTRNVLGELKVASLWSKREQWNLSPFDLVKMITANPGDVLEQAWGIQLGRLQSEAMGDLVVISAAQNAKPFDRILAATEEDVQLVVVGGRPLYGTPQLMTQAGGTKLSALKLKGQSRRLSLTRMDPPGQAWSLAKVMARLNQVRANPKAAIENAHRRVAAALREGRPTPFRMALDMPTGLVPIGGLPKNLGLIRIPPIESLAHNSAFFSSITGRGFHGGLLDGLASFYK
jgi:cytosine/adenosine deaminase-related metal-dependent hydrolase